MQVRIMDVSCLFMKQERKKKHAQTKRLPHNFICHNNIFILLDYAKQTNKPFFQISLIFGMNNKHNVAVVDVKINVVIIMKASVTRSDNKFASTTTLALVMTTL
jgi:hypothetical protein